MTITLDTSDPKAAKKALAAALKAQKIQDALDRQNSDLADLRAQAAGYRVLSRKAEGTILESWGAFKPGDKYFSHLCYRDKDREYDAILSTRDTNARFNTYSSEIISVVADGCGWVMAVFVREMQYDSGSFNASYYPNPNGKVSCYAVGASDNQSSWVELPGVVQSDFKPHAK